MQSTLERLRQRRDERGDEGGFTLIELLIVIVILGILAAIVVFAVQNLSKSSSQASCGSDQKTVETAVEAYKAQVGVYPGAALPSGVTLGTPGAVPAGNYKNAAEAVGIVDLLSTYTVTGGGTVGPWLKDVPANPTHYAIGVGTNALGGLIIYNGTGTTATVTACTGLTN